MRCKKCGAVLKKDGDLCAKCSNQIRKETELKSDKKEILRIKKKYSPKYILTKKMIEVYFIFFIIILFSIVSHKVLATIFAIFLLLAIMIISLIIGKKNAAQTHLSFYESKVVFKGIYFMFFKIDRVLAYEDIKDIVFTQGTNWLERVFQKAFNLGNIYIYPKKGNILTKGMQLEIVDNIDDVIKKIEEVVGDRISNE